MIAEEDIKNALKAVKYPGYNRDIVSFGLVKEIAAGKGAVSVLMKLTGGNAEVARQIKTESEGVLRALPGVASVFVDVTHDGAAPVASGRSPWAQQNKLPGIRRAVDVASGKGGVGKSTVSVNLACGLQHFGAEGGTLGFGIYGPRDSRVVGGGEKPTSKDAAKKGPPTRPGVESWGMGIPLGVSGLSV